MRQLNLCKGMLKHYHGIYINVIDGFRKMTRLLQGTLSKAFQVEPIEFWHANFRRGHPELLHLVQRKVGGHQLSLEYKCSTE